jgi:amino acid transporter
MNKKISLLEAISIGIGGMVGGGIFAVLGLAVSLAKGGTPLAFLIAGIIALITSFNYAKLSNAYPSRGGTVTFINKGFGKGVFSGGTNNLLWISYIIMLSLYASAFGAYAPTLFSLTTSQSLDHHIYASLIIIMATVINYYNVKLVSKIEKWAVGIKMIILLSFVAIGLYGLTFSEHIDQLSMSNWPSMWGLSIGGMVIFVAYEGFELIANVASDIDKPERNISRSYLISTLTVVALYVVIAIITVGSLSFSDISTAQDYVLAEAAKPILGKIGFKIIALAALISTFSAINASIYGGSKVNYELAEDDELPHEFTKIFWNQPVGLLVTSVLTLFVTNVLDLSSISTSGSAGFLLIFLLVNLSAFIKRKEIRQNTVFPILGVILCATAFGGLLYEQLFDNKLGALFAIGIIVSCYLLEYAFKQGEKRSNHVI